MNSLKNHLFYQAKQVSKEIYFKKIHVAAGRHWLMVLPCDLQCHVQNAIPGVRDIVQPERARMRNVMKILIGILVVLAIIAALAGTIMSNVEQPKYKVILSENNIEVREYAPMVLAEVEVSGERKEAINQGFKMLADYIFGNNVSKTKMEMTAPVTSELNEKLAMTAPVMQQGQGDKWKVRFVMPASYTIDTLPTPNSSSVNLISIPAKRFVVIRFSGLAGEENIQLQTEELKAYISEQNLKTIGSSVLAFYNPPWTLPFLRRNELMIEVPFTSRAL